jgi:ribosomal protein S18 acetylase RimI-like enzyme
MTNNPSQGMIKKQILSPADINEVERLAQICNDFEHLDMRIDWIEIRPEYFGNMHDYLYYGHVLLICERGSASGQAFVATLGARLDFSEHKMVLETFHERFAFDDRLSFQRAYMDDLDALITIISDGWGRSAEDVRESVSFNLGEPHCQVYIARFGGNELSCGEPVGCLRVYDMGNEMGIYGFVVRPAYRGLGYGRQMLEEVILDIRSSVNSSKSIMLEVDTDNSVALNLYRSIGMEIKRTYEYYDIGANI